MLLKHTLINAYLPMIVPNAGKSVSTHLPLKIYTRFETSCLLMGSVEGPNYDVIDVPKWLSGIPVVFFGVYLS